MPASGQGEDSTLADSRRCSLSLRYSMFGTLRTARYESQFATLKDRLSSEIGATEGEFVAEHAVSARKD